MRKFLIFITHFILISFIGMIAFHQIYTLRYKSLKTDLAISKELIKEYQLKDRTIINMEKTLHIAYGLSHWEGKYYSVIFYDFAESTGVDWEVYAALIRIESNFRTTLKSEGGAKGIAQILEGTAEEVCKKLDIKYVENETLWNDLLNLVIGLSYFSDGYVVSNETTHQAKITHAVRRYLGGPDYKKNIKVNEKTKNYIGNYKTSVMKEYKRLIYIYKGVVAEN